VTNPMPPCPRCGLVPVWPYGCPCGHISPSGAPASQPYAPYPAPGPYGPAGGYPPGHGPMVPGVQYHVQHTVISPKSGGVAVLLTFLWLGTGHLYLGRTTPGVLLLVLNLFLFFLLVIPIIGWVLGFLGWVAAFIAASISCSSIAAQDNARLAPPPFRSGPGW